MIIETVVLSLGAVQSDWPKQAELRTGEVLRSYEKTMSRRGVFEKILVLTPTKVFVKDGETCHFALLSKEQQIELKSILATEPKGLRDKPRENPMWPSTYDGTDHWMSYRVGRTTKTWTNKAYEFPENAALGEFLASIYTRR
ncbi:MAG TPA: hypothetical protein VK171_01945 [Fimbriimonas sp.]|nr:hypothetical protein [Fimbriimonas sp.]